jgi:hypothetical protein
MLRGLAPIHSLQASGIHATGGREPRHIVSFDIVSLDIVSLEIVSLDIVSLDIVSLQMP